MWRGRTPDALLLAPPHDSTGELASTALLLPLPTLPAPPPPRA
jgi:hypothetical protein